MVDRRYDVEIAGHKYLVSREGGRYGRRSIPLQKAQQDTSGDVGEQSLNTEDLWRRSMSTWHRGAGQTWLDEEDSDRRRFRASLGVDPWTKKQLTLLNETEVKLASTASTVKLAVAGSYLYCADGQTLKYTTSITGAGAATWTTVTGTPAAAITGLTSDGQNIYVSFGVNGIYSSVAGNASVSLYSSQPTSILGFEKGRLMSAYGPAFTNVTEASPSTISFIAAGTGYSTTESYIDVELRAETVPGDVVIIGLAWVSSAAILPVPDGWTLIDRTTAADAAGVAPMSNSAIYWKRYEATDGSSVRFTFDATVTAGAASSVVYRDAYGSNPIDVVLASALTAGGATIDSPSITTTQNNTRLLSVLAFMGTAGSPIVTTPTGMTSRVATGGTGGGFSVLSQIADVAQATAGASGVKQWAVSANYDDAVATTLAIVTSHADPLLTHANSSFTWVGFAEGQGDIYAAGYSGDKSLIYRTQIRPDGTALDAPVVAGSLPDGEIVRSIYGYLGILFIGTDNGVRMAVSDANGDLTIGALIETASPVRCFEGQGRFVWFGLEDYDISRWGSGTYDGLGRLDLTQQTDQLVPAWASDLMAAASTSTTESVQSVVTFQDRRLFSIGSSDALSRGVYGEKATKVATGYLDSGLVTYGIADTKVATYADLRHRALAGTVTVYLSADEAAFASIGSSSTPGSARTTDPLDAGPTRGDTHETRLVLARSGSDTTTGPAVTRLTLRSEPAPARGEVLQWPLVLTKRLSVVGQERPVAPDEELLFIKGLFDAQTLVTCKQNDETFDAFLQDYEFMYEHRTDDKRTEQGICTVTLKVPAS